MGLGFMRSWLVGDVREVCQTTARTGAMLPTSLGQEALACTLDHTPL
jgi:hypothetical protein